MAKMTPKQQKFCDEYLVTGNAAESARRAGYSKKTAEQIGKDNLRKATIRAYIDEHLDALHKEKIAEADEVLQYLTSVMRGESRSSVLVLAGNGVQVPVEKAPDERERTKAAELLARRYGLLNDKVSLEGVQPVMIVGEEHIRD